MTVQAKTSYIASSSSYSGRPTGAFLDFICSTTGELPSADLLDGDTAYVTQTGITYLRSSGAWGQTSREYVDVSSLAQLPAPSGGVITLADNTNYLVCGEVDISPNRIVFGVRSTISGTNRINDRIISDTAGNLFTATSSAVTVVFKEIGLRCANGTLVSFSDCGVSFIDCSVGPCANGGNIALSGAFPFTFRQGSMVSGFTTSGFTFSGTSTGTLRIFDNTISNNVGTLFALGAAVFGIISIGRNSVIVSGGNTFLSGAAAGANVTVAGQLAINAFSGAGTYVSTITGADAGWTFTANAGVTNTAGTVAWGAVTGTLSNQSDLQTALNLKANIASPTFTGTVGGITAAMVGLGNVNNTSDASKPVSTATQTALDAKQATLVSGTNIKTVNGSTLLGAGDLSTDPAYAPGSFTIATGTGRLFIKRAQLTTTQRATLTGTARLRLT